MRKFVNTQYFIEEALKFKRDGFYTNALIDSPAYNEYWDEQKKRCIEGYQVGGVKITGDHYFYLNFCPIKRLLYDNKGNPLGFEKKRALPDFYDGDYDYYWVVEIGRNGITQEEFDKLSIGCKVLHLGGGRHIIIGKARRKGFSYKNAALVARRYTFFRNSYSMITAYDSSYSEGTMKMVVHYLNFLNEHTAFGKRRLVDKQREHIISGFKEEQNGIWINKGYQSEIEVFTFKDNPEAGAGKDAGLILLEEAGTFANLKASYNFLKPCVEEGDFTTGQMLIYGTGGDMDGSTLDFYEMFYNPEPYKLLPIENMWDEGAESTSCGFFFPSYMNMQGFIDSEGNSLKQEAINKEIEEREKIIKTAKDKNTLIKHMIANPFSPKEAFAIASTNIFPIYELSQQLNKVEFNGDIDTIGIKGRLLLDDRGNPKFEKDDKLKPAGYPVTDLEEGCLVVWEPPIGNPPTEMYIIGLDPYSHDRTIESKSLGSLFVYKRGKMGESDRIVAEYTGRPRTTKDFNETARRICIYYNAKILYENNVNNIKEYFENKNCLYLLAKGPTCLKSTVNTLGIRSKGLAIHGKDLKMELEGYASEWLLEVNSEGIPNYKFIYSVPLLKELISYNDVGNFDRVIAFLLCIIYKIQLTKLVVEERKEESRFKSFFSKKIFINNNSINNK